MKPQKKAPNRGLDFIRRTAVLLAGFRFRAGVGRNLRARTGGKCVFPHSLLGELTTRHLRTVGHHKYTQRSFNGGAD
jgi:hypothetical protein